MLFLRFYHVLFCFVLFTRKGKSYIVSVEEDAQILFQFCMRKIKNLLPQNPHLKSE